MLTAKTIQDIFVTLIASGNLSSEELNAVNKFLEGLNERYSGDDAFNEDILNALSVLYRIRWLQILAKDKEKGYPRMPDGVNTPWLSLAKMLVDEGYLSLYPTKVSKYHYINFIMPTVMNYQSSVTLEYLADTPLNQLILSEDGTKLISLDDVFNTFHYNKVFGYFIDQSFYHLTLHELSLVQHAYIKNEQDEKVYVYWQKYIEEVLPFYEKNSSLSLSILLQIKTLIEESCFQEGFFSNYSESQNIQAQQAYDNFRRFIEALSSEERDKLFAEQIAHQFNMMTFGEIWLKSVTDKICITYAALYYMKLFKDYLPHIKLKGDLLEEWATRLGPSEHKKVCIPNFELSHDVCKVRCQQLMTYIITNKFQVMGTGSEISLGTYTNIVPETALLIFNELQLVSVHQNWQLAFYNILENVVKPQVQKEKPFGRYQETHEWLQSVYNGSFFEKESSINYAEISRLLQNLCDASRGSSVNQVARNNYINQLISLSANLQKTPTCTKSKKKLIKICSEIRHLMNDNLLSISLNEDNFSAINVIKNVAIDNLLSQFACKTVSISTFWGTTSTMCVDEEILLKLKRMLNVAFEEDDLSIEKALLDVFHKVNSGEQIKGKYNFKLAEKWLKDLGVNPRPEENMLENTMPLLAY